MTNEKDVEVAKVVRVQEITRTAIRSAGWVSAAALAAAAGANGGLFAAAVDEEGEPT